MKFIPLGPKNPFSSRLDELKTMKSFAFFVSVSSKFINEKSYPKKRHVSLMIAGAKTNDYVESDRKRYWGVKRAPQYFFGSLIALIPSGVIANVSNFFLKFYLKKPLVTSMMA